MAGDAFAQFNIQLGGDLTWNVQPLLHEIRHALLKYIGDGEPSVIDLRSIPLAPGEEDSLLKQLGRGEVSVKLDALGPSEIYETAYAGVWLVTHYNAENNIIGRFIEITNIPEIVRSQQEDIQDAVTQLEAALNNDNE